MKKLFTSAATILLCFSLYAQPVLVRDSIQTGLTFNLYQLSNVSISDLYPSGANVTWDLSSSTATLAGTAEFLDMAATPYASQYPNANFAIKLSPTGVPSRYSLFNLTSSIMEEVANNVGTTEAKSFSNPRTTLLFPYTYNVSNTDTYQKNGQGAKTIVHTYDAYGTFKSNTTTYNNVVRDLMVDDGDTSAHWWSAAPFFPLFQADDSGLTLWQISSITTGVSNISYTNLFDLYPNPATNILTIVNKEIISNIEVYNVSGQLQFTTVQSTIDISHLSAGVYFIKAYSTKGTTTAKFIKQ